MSATRQAHKRSIKFAVIAASASGDNTLVAGVPGKRIRVLSYDFVCDTAVSVRFESAASGTALAGPYSCSANGGKVNGWNEGGWFQTEPGELLNMELSGNVSVGGCLSYIEEVGN